MYREQSVEVTTDEVHCYFPEWADRPASAGTASESEYNSYMAGGYAEEFGYRSSTGGPPGLAILAGDPEGSRLWRVQIGGLHPGYPECARPLDRGAEGELPPPQRERLSQPRQDLWDKAEVRFTAVRVRRDHPAGAGSLDSWRRAWRMFRRALSGRI